MSRFGLFAGTVDAHCTFFIPSCYLFLVVHFSALSLKGDRAPCFITFYPSQMTLSPMFFWLSDVLISGMITQQLYKNMEKKLFSKQV